MNLEIGQVLWLKIKYKIDEIAKEKHPMLIAKVNEKYIEVIALDKTKGRLQNLYRPYNVFISIDNPNETVITQDSYAQLNNKFTIENTKELLMARKTRDKLSKKKLDDVLTKYSIWHEENIINEERIVHMDKKDILVLNPDLKLKEIVGIKNKN